MTLIKQKVRDPLVLRLIWKYLRSPMQIDGKLQKRRKGVPQGGPLSPLLSNIVLNELDQELEERALRFVRYADDFSVFVKTSRAAHRVKRRITWVIENRLHLLVNEKKSSIRRPLHYEYLGFAFESSYQRGVRGQYQLVVSKSSWAELKYKIKQITRKTIPASFDERIERLNLLMRGWLNYFKPASIFGKLRTMDGWAVSCSPILITTITLDRLKCRGYISFLEYYLVNR